jgi:holo-[acyl-carrier protein] synthase
MIGIGVDLVDIERFRRSLERTPTMRTRLFTEVELAYVAPRPTRSRRWPPASPLARP